MRISVALRNALLLFVRLASPALLLAQFQQPTPDELKMTDDPKAPGAAAVYLNVEEIANDPLHYQSFYARIKVLTEKGKELATVEVPHWQTTSKVTNIKARTIHADGTVIPLTGKPADLLIFKTKTKSWRELPGRQEGLYPAQCRGWEHPRVSLRIALRRRTLFDPPVVGDSAALLGP